MKHTEYQQLSQLAGKLRPSLRASLFELAVQCLVLGLGFWLSSLSLPFWLAGQVLLGISFWRSFAILHACGHHAFSSEKRLDDLIGLSQSLFCFIPYYSWKDIHFDHHRWTGWLDRDPTMKNLERKPSAMTLKVLNFCWKFWIPVISIHYILTVFFTKNESHRNPLKVFLSMLLVVSAHATAIALLGSEYARYFALSTFLYLNLGDVSLLTQHVHLPMDHSGGNLVEPKKLWEQDAYSHTVEVPEWMGRWIFSGFNYHSLHHLFPTLPYYLTEFVPFRGAHTHEGLAWLRKAKAMRASDLIYVTRPDPNPRLRHSPLLLPDHPLPPVLPSTETPHHQSLL